MDHIPESLDDSEPIVQYLHIIVQYSRRFFKLEFSLEPNQIL